MDNSIIGVTRDVSIATAAIYHLHQRIYTSYDFLRREKKKKIGQSAIQEAIKSETARRQSAGNASREFYNIRCVSA